MFIRPVSPVDCQPTQVVLVNYRRAGLNKDAADTRNSPAGMPSARIREMLRYRRIVKQPRAHGSTDAARRGATSRCTHYSLAVTRSRTLRTYAVRSPGRPRYLAKYRVNRSSFYEIIISIGQLTIVQINHM